MKRLILITAVAVALGAPLALADSAPGNMVAPITHTKTHLATSDPMGRCAMLDARFQRANMMHAAGSYAREAAALHLERDALLLAPAGGGREVSRLRPYDHPHPAQDVS